MKILVLILILCSSFNKFSCTASLINLPLRVSDENVILHATLVDKISSKSWYIKEYLSAAYSIHGKIEIDSDDYSYKIFYNKKSDDKRLVIHDNQCEEYRYDGYEHWDKMLPGVTSSLPNMILLLGPSILYRLQDDIHSYIKGPTMKIRGVDMESLTREISPKLKIAIYYKSNQESEEGLLEPSRIEFNGYNLHLDILLQAIVNDNHHIKTQVTPGIGCPFYMETNKPFPKLVTHRMHMIINERVTESINSTISNSEIYVDNLAKIVRMKKGDGQNNIRLLYDYNIGISYSSINNKVCQLKEIDLDAPGLNNENQLDLLQFFDMNRPLRFVGELDYNLQSGHLASAWESVDYNITYRNKQYDKLVVTIYMGKSSDFTGFVLDDQNYLPLSVTVKGYLKNAKNFFNLETNINREIHIYQNDFVETDARQILQLKECYSSETLDLTFKLISIDVKKLQLIMKDYVEKIKDSLLDIITKNGNISPLRVENVDFEIKLDHILVTVTFSRPPTVDDIFEVNIRRLDIKKITATAVTVASLTKCVEIQSLMSRNLRTVVYCDHDKDILCESYSDSDQLIDDKKSGALCLTIESKMGKLRQLGQQISLDSIHDYLLHSAVGSILTIPCENCYHEKYLHFKVDDVVDASSSLETSYENEKEFKGPYSNRVLAINSEHTILVENIKNFGDCYRSCSLEYNSQCSSFSYCQTDEVKCIISNEGYKDAKFDIERSCNTYYAKYETKYHRIKSKKFKNIKSQPISLTKSDDCAKSCSENESECYSYQFCEAKGLCYFTSHYSQELIESSNECDIYIPKKIHNYQLTGPTIIMNTNHIEIDLNIDQCASLCSGWENGGNEKCKSFNFCPKSRSSASSCYLSAYTVHDGNVKTVDSSDCRNYVLKSEQSIKSEFHTNLRKHNSSNIKIASLAFGFLFVGLITGFVAPLIVGKLKSFINRSKKRDFSWDRQVDETDETYETTI